MRRSNQPTPGTESTIPVIAMGTFAVIFWGATMLVWRAALKDVRPPYVPPSIFLTLLAFLLPPLSYWMMSITTPRIEGRPISLGAYVNMQVFGLIIWVLSVWLWLTAWLEAVLPESATNVTFFAIFIFQLLPYWFWLNSITLSRRATPPAAPPTAPASGAARRPSSVADDESWLKWMGKGETQRGVLIFIAALFWTMLYWNFQGVQELPLTVSIPIWGLLTILMLTIIRLMSKQSGPSGEVSAAPDPKSKTPGK